MTSPWLETRSAYHFGFGPRTGQMVARAIFDSDFIQQRYTGAVVLETDSGETKNQPFLFLFDAAATYSISGTIYEDINGDASLADAVGFGIDVVPGTGPVAWAGTTMSENRIAASTP